MIYLDYNATSLLRPEAKSAMIDAMTWDGNPSSIHHYGRASRVYVDQARTKIRTWLDAKMVKIIFTSGGTESNNLAVFGVRAPQYVFSAIEHDAVLKTVPSFIKLPVEEKGTIDLSAAADIIQKLPQGSLISVMLANNETGVIQPLKEIAKLAHNNGCFVHTDAVQAIGRIPVSFQELGVDMMSISAHKFGGPVGIGALLVRDELQLMSHMRGGGQEYGMRAGTVSVVLIAGMVRALEVALNKKDSTETQITKWRDFLEQEITKISLQTQIFGQNRDRLGNTSCLTMPGVSAELQVIAFDLEKIAVSAGAACSSGKIKTSHVLKSMGVLEKDATTAIRVSLGWQTQESDIHRFIDVWKKIFLSQLSCVA